MKLTLKKLKHAKFASHETECFEATVCIDGIPSIDASNEGTGGPNCLYDIVPGSVARVEAYAKTLPQYEGWTDEATGTKHMLDYDADTIISDLVDEELNKRGFKRKLGRMLVIAIKSDAAGDKKGVYEYPKMKPIPANLERMTTKLTLNYGEAVVILNALPFDEAWEIAKALGA